MSAVEQQTNHALRLLDGDFRAGRTTVDDYRRRRRHLLARLRESLQATLDVTVRRPTSVARRPATDASRAGRSRRVRTRAVIVWIVLLLLLAGGAWILLPLANGE